MVHSAHTVAVSAVRWPTLSSVTRLVPGLVYCLIPAAAGLALHRVPALGLFSPMILAVVVGIALRSAVGLPRVTQAGVTFVLKRLLRIAVALLGLQLTAAQVAAVGPTGVAIIALSLVATFVFTKTVGRWLGVPAPLAELIAAGTSICGASAVVAANTVTQADDEDAAYAVACVTVFGSIAMLSYPALGAALHLAPRAVGLWAGASIHEIAQVVAAAFQSGQQAGEFGTVAKLTRVAMLAPLVLSLGALRRRREGTGGKPMPMPWFILGFVALVALNSLHAVPAMVKDWAPGVTTSLLTLALAAMGLHTHVGRMAAKGFAPLALGALASLFIAGLSLVLIVTVWA
ncbi:putative integral membrane protein (TIGR00698 family) [Nitrospirillum amazonense]|uniref:Putative integral membrane protein (TIGR00698 family) n=1 Tax=Nitrospirillum amazonense TaxID=28077 RepID=A0A560JDJ0_9PROT|nr:YeiH family protein [Nitrospirillum amazonense]TWB69263.1 putative integral membrane protein (TIGR00698 family) [Nitrospirillum amazonense]